MTRRRVVDFVTGLSGLWLLFALLRGGVAWTPAFVLSGSLFLRSKDSRAAVFFGALALYLSTFRWRGGDDTPATLLPIAMLKHGSLALDSVIDPWLTGKWHDFVIEAGGRKLTLFSIVPSMLALPVYFLPVLLNAPLSVQFLHNLSKLSAALITAASVKAFYVGVRPRCSSRWAMAATAFYALSCFSWSVASQGLWEHGPAQLGLALGLMGLFNSWDAIAGFGFALAVGARPDTALFATAAGCWLIFAAPRRLPRFLLGALVPLAVLGTYWLHYTGKLEPPEMQFHAHVFKGLNVEALLGFLVSPTRGLLFYCPVAFFGIWGALRRGWKDVGPWLLASCLASLLLVSSYGYWTGGMTYGPRYLSGAATILIFFCADLEPALRGRWLSAFAFAGAFSVLLGALGAYLNWPGSYSYEVQTAQVWWFQLHPVAQVFMAEGGLGRLPAALRGLIGLLLITGTIHLSTSLRRRFTPSSNG